MDLTLIWKTVLIGIVEGVTEFLPVSSTGHIILAEEVLNFQGPPGKVFEIVIQLGAILAVCVLYRAKIWGTVTGVLRREPLAMRFAMAVIVAFLPAVVVGVAAHQYIKALLEKPVVVAVALIVGGFAILLIERFAHSRDVMWCCATTAAYDARAVFGDEPVMELCEFLGRELINCPSSFVLRQTCIRQHGDVFGGVVAQETHSIVHLARAGGTVQSDDVDVVGLERSLCGADLSP